MKWWLPISLLFFTSSSWSQNLVFNGNFERYIGCPTSWSQIDSCEGWRRYTDATSDFFHVCGSPDVHIPDNVSGYQEVASGKAYAGIYVYQQVENEPREWYEYLAGSLTPLVPGKTYEVSMSASLADSSRWGINGLGIWFYENNSFTLPGTEMLTVQPQLSFAGNGVITDTKNWVRLSANFTADSAYDNIVIGAFKPSAGFHKQEIRSNYLGPVSWSYYYIDSISVRLITGINNLHSDTLVCVGDTFDVPFSVNPGFVFNPGNIFSAVLSDPSGSFQSGTTIVGTLQGTKSGSIQCVVPKNVQTGAGYYIRVMSSDMHDSSGISTHPITIRSLDATAHVDLPVCSGDTIHLYSIPSAQAGISYQWTGPNGYSSDKSDNYLPGAIASRHNGTYRLTVSGNGCTVNTGVDVKVTTLDLGPDDILCKNESRVLKPDIGSTTYLWQDGSNASEYLVNKEGTYWVTADTKCGILSDTVVIKFEVCDCVPFFPTAFTPNNDGLNDAIAPIVDCKATKYNFIIVNRWGEVVFKSSTQGEKWNGMYKNQRAESGTYFYLLQLTGPRGNASNFKGDIVLMR